MKDVFVEGQGENVVYFLCQVDLSHLQFRQIVCHHRVLEIGVYHFFKQKHILARKLTQSLIQQVTDFGVTSLFAVNDALNIKLALR